MLYPAVGSGKIRQHTDLDLGVLPWYTLCVAIEMRKSWKINENHHELNQPSNFGVLDFQALSRWDPLFLGSHNLSAQNPQNIPKSFLVLKNQLVTPRLCKKKAGDTGPTVLCASLKLLHTHRQDGYWKGHWQKAPSWNIQWMEEILHLGWLKHVETC